MVWQMIIKIAVDSCSAAKPTGKHQMGICRDGEIIHIYGQMIYV